MDDWKEYFKGKKITILGLGLLGKGLGDAVFLAQCGAKVTVTDLKSEEALASSVAVLKKYKNVTLRLGGHDFSDFENCDFVLKGQGVPIDSPYIARARDKKIPVRMDDELFASFVPNNVKVIGVTGTRGKTTTSSLIYHILKKAGKSVYLGGNIRGVATLALLKKVKPGDFVVLELSSWQLQGFGEMKKSPEISVFTNIMPDHLNYYKGSMRDYFADKVNIFKYQKPEDSLIVSTSMEKKIPKAYKGKITITGVSDVPESWILPILGEHNRENIACAIAVAKILKIPLIKIKEGVESFKAAEGRLQFMKSIKGVRVYNDNNSTTPDATIAALMSLPEGKIVLIFGGADKNLNTKKLFQLVNKKCKAAVILPGSGTEKFLKNHVLKTKSEMATDLKDAVSKAFNLAEKNDVILFSPAFASFGMFTNEYDRGDQFIEIIKKIK